MNRMQKLLARLLGRDRDCEEIRALMSDYVDGDLESDGIGRVDAHVGRCPRCRRVLANLRLTVDRLTRLGTSTSAPEPSDDAAERIQSAWRGPS
jgi:anti-sigma factor RsiW